MQIKRLIRSVVIVIALSYGALGHAAAATISVGVAIPITATTFALPIEIANAIELTSWQFDLAYDPTDVQVNTACDPFSDVFCSLITGPVTEGDFFAGGAPFNLLNPGFIDLDPATLTQTGLLFAVQGAYGGFLPAPSGNGILAYVQFITIGTGGSPITVQNPSVTENVAAVPEPASVMLLTAGLSLLTGRAIRHRGKRS